MLRLIKVFSLTLLLQPIAFSAYACPLPTELPYQKGWLGGDVASSLELSGGETLWIFGDTFADINPSATDRTESTFINNSIALSSCRDDKFQIEYFWGETDEGLPDSFFLNSNEAGDEFYWPLSLFMFDSNLYINLLRVTYDETRKLGFREVGVDLVRVKNWQERPKEWKKETFNLSTSLDIFPAAEVVVDGESIYFYSYYQGNYGQKNAVAKLDGKTLSGATAGDDLSDELLYLHQDGTYKIADIENLEIILYDGNTELNIFRKNNHWYLVRMQRNRALELMDPSSPSITPDKITLQKSDHFLGPWSEREVIHVITETIEGHDRFHSKNFCYAAKYHTSAMVSYVCNSMDFDLIHYKMDIYRPQLIHVKTL